MEDLSYQCSSTPLSISIQQQESFAQTVCPQTVDFGTQYAFTTFNEKFSCLNSINFSSFNRLSAEEEAPNIVNEDYMNEWVFNLKKKNE